MSVRSQLCFIACARLLVLDCSGATAASEAQAAFACIVGVGYSTRDSSRDLVKISVLRAGERELPLGRERTTR
jgi:hypothetical protein